MWQRERRDPARPRPQGRAVKLLSLVALAMLGCPSAEVDYSGPVAEWPAYGGDVGGARYSPLHQIDRDNVGQLEVAWTYHTGDVDRGEQTILGTAFQNTPIVVGDTLYLCSPRNRAIASTPPPASSAGSTTPRWTPAGCTSSRVAG